MQLSLAKKVTARQGFLGAASACDLDCRLHHRHRSPRRVQHRLARGRLLPALDAWRPGIHGCPLGATCSI